MKELDGWRGGYPGRRPRRNRRHAWSRKLVRENWLSSGDLIWPVFIQEGSQEQTPIPSMPGVERHTVDRLVPAVGRAVELEIPAVALFPATDPAKKTPGGEEALNPDNLVCQAIRAVKESYGDAIGVICDVALDPYSSHGHDGLIRDGYVVNDENRRSALQSGARAGGSRL